MKEYFISHPQDLADFIQAIKEQRLPLYINVDKAVPTKEHIDYESRSKQMAYFHRTICTAFADAEGVNEEEAKYQLLGKFGIVEEIIQDESGEWDTVWLEEDKLRVFTQGKIHRVRSVAAMNNEELARLIDQSKNYLLQYHGIMVTNFNKKYKTK